MQFETRATSVCEIMASVVYTCRYLGSLCVGCVILDGDLWVKMPDKFEFRAVTTFGSSSGREASDAISSIDFSPDGSHFATGGLAKKLRFYKLKSSANEGTEEAEGEAEGEVCKVEEIYTPAKLSSLAWCPWEDGVITCGDYDGVVTEWKIECGVAVVERYEHGGRRAWSVDYSRAEHRPGLSASASADGTVRLWAARTEGNVGIIKPSSPSLISVCSVQFSPLDPSLIATASADGSFSLFDIRKYDRCVRGTRGHARAVSYVRFGGDDTVVSASIDNTVKVWDMEFGMVRKWEGHHLNVRNFVGLSVLERSGEGGLIACGSETNQVFVYERDGERPIWRSSTLPSSNKGGAFVGAVCWRRVNGGSGSVCFGDVHCLVAANSDGSLQLIHARVLR